MDKAGLTEFPKRPEFNALEEEMLEFWEKEKLFEFNPAIKKPVYSIDTPPPTISGNLHIGHAFSYSQAEFIARYKRMQGFNVFYPFGYDNNGLPTERLTEETHKITAKSMPRQDFVKLCLKTSEKVEREYEAVFRRMGLSCDWNHVYRTIEPRIQGISQHSFLKLYEMKRVYRKLAPTIWCPKCETAISQVELEDKETKSEFTHLLFKLENSKSIEIATTRPELLPSCCAVFVNPEDNRYKHLIGKKVVVPLFGFKVPVLADKRALPEKGTGIVMFCTFGDLADVDWFNAYQFEPKISITSEGKMTDLAGKFKGMKIKDARKAIVNELKEKGFLVKQVPVNHSVNVHERCGTQAEFILSKQWFVKYLDLKKKFLDTGRKITWWPEYMRIRYDNWVKGLQWDWCISRQRFFGVPFPVWYCKKCGKEILATEKQLPVDPLTDKPEKKCACGNNEFEPEKDVFDTWATSALTPLINAGWPEKKQLKLYPISLRPNAHDIITFWDFNSVVMGLLHAGQEPFANIMISGHGLDKKGKKMSKSRGNVVLPLDAMKKYSADALRWWASGVKLGEDLNFREEDLQLGLKQSTKLWNTVRFASMHIQKKPLKPKNFNIVDKWILAELSQTISDCTAAFEAYEYSKAKMKAENFFWNTFCDYYIEMIKHRLYSGNEKESALWTFYNVLLIQLKLFAPIIPFVTEKLFQVFFKKWEKEKSIHLSEWPEPMPEWLDENSLEKGRVAMECIAAARKWKKLKNKSLAEPVEFLSIMHPKPETAEKIKKEIEETARVKQIEFKKSSDIYAE